MIHEAGISLLQSFKLHQNFHLLEKFPGSKLALEGTGRLRKMFSVNQAYSVGLAEGYEAGMTEALTVPRIYDCNVGASGRQRDGAGSRILYPEEKLIPRGDQEHADRGLGCQ